MKSNIKLNRSSRYSIIDQVRGFAVVLMIIFHFFYDLNLFRYCSIDFAHDTFWWGLPRVIVFLFLFAVGLSLPIVHLPQIKWNKVLSRFLKIALLALIISFGTYFLFPSSWIYFGTLHCIALVGLMSLPLLNSPNIALLIFLGLVIPSAFLGLNLPWILLPHFSMDYISPFPWFGIVCLGIFSFHHKFHFITLPPYKVLELLKFLGKHALIIYLLHQVIMYSIIWSFYSLTH